MSGSVSRGALVSLAAQWSKYLIQIAAVVLFSRLLTPEDLGLVTMAAAITGVAWLLGDLGLSAAALQADELTHAQQTQLFWTNLGIGAVVSSLVAGSAPLIALLYDEPRLTAVVLATSPCFLLNSALTQFRVRISRDGRFGTLAVVDIAAQVAGLVGGLAVVLLGGGYWGLVVQPLVVNAVMLAGNGATARWWPSLPRRGVPMRHLYRFGGGVFGIVLASYATTNADSVVIGSHLGTRPLGWYNRAFQLSAVPILQLASPLTKVMLPALSRRRHDPAAFRSLTTNIQLALGYGLGGALAVLAVEAEHVVPLALGSGWDQAADVLPVLCIASAFEVAFFCYHWLSLAHAKVALQFYVEIGPRIAMIALMFLVADRGIMWVAGALAVGHALNWLCGCIFVLPAVGLPRVAHTWTAIRPILVVAAAAGISLAVGSTLPAGLPDVVALLAGTALWCLALAVLTVLPPVRRDLATLVHLARTMRRRDAQRDEAADPAQA